MINRLHGDGATRASIEYPSFNEEFAGESGDDLRNEFIALLDKIATSSRRASQTDDLISASIAAAGSLAASPARPVEASKPVEPKQVVEDFDQSYLKKGPLACAPDQAKSQPTEHSTPDVPRVMRSDEGRPIAGQSHSKVDETELQSQDVPAEASLNQETSAPAATGQNAVNTAVPEDIPGEVHVASVVQGELLGITESLEVPADQTEGVDAAAPGIEGATFAEGAAIISPLNAENSAAPENAVESSAIAGMQQDSTAEALETVGTESSVIENGSAGALATDVATTSVDIPEYQEQSVELTFKPTEPKGQGVAAAAVASAFLQRPDAAIKFALLKENFEVPRYGVGEVRGAQASHASSTGLQHANSSAGMQNSPVFEVQNAQRTPSGVAKESTRPLPKNFALRTLERVESAIKEAARSRDGKTLSFRLDPPQLGQVKVDVTLKEGALHARLVPENQQVAALLRERAPELQSTLRRLGLNVETVTISVGNEQVAVSNGGADGSANGKSFQQGRNNLPGQEGQVAETSFGNELALHGEATKASTDDHWVA